MWHGIQRIKGRNVKLLMMGTGPFAVPSFQALLKSEHEITCLVTRPDKIARGRKKAPPNPMRDAADAAGVEVLAPESINSEEGLEILDRFEAELLVVCDYGQILSREALGKATLGGINLHGSLLPKYRGAAPINWALLNGDPVAGITVIHMTPRLDGGPMLCRRSLDVGPTENAVELEERLSQLGVDAVLESIGLLSTWDGESVIGELQDKEQVTKAPRLKKSDGQIDWSKRAREILNQVRALQPWPGTFTNLLRDGKDPMRVIVKEVAIHEGDAEGSPGDARGGSVIVVRCGEGAIEIPKIQPAGKREMESMEFVRGYGTTLKFGS